MELGANAWVTFRHEIYTLLANGHANHEITKTCLLALSEVQLYLPLVVSAFTDFYASRHHATNVGKMFRGVENALPLNWLHVPVAYNGSASTVVVSGTEIQRPMEQIKAADKILSS